MASETVLELAVYMVLKQRDLPLSDWEIEYEIKNAGGDLDPTILDVREAIASLKRKGVVDTYDGVKFFHTSRPTPHEAGMTTA